MKNQTIEFVKINHAKVKREKVSKAEAWEHHAKAGKAFKCKALHRDSKRLGEV